MVLRVLCQDRLRRRFKKHIQSNSQVQHFSFICIANIRFIKKHFFASLSHVDLFFKDEVEGMHRTTLFPVIEGDIIPDNFLPTSLLEKWETLEAFESRLQMHVNLANSFKKMKFEFNPRRGHDSRQNLVLISKQMRAYHEACFHSSIISTVSFRVLPSAAIPLRPSNNGINSITSSSSDSGSGGGGIGGGHDGASERGTSQSYGNGGSGEHGSGVGEAGEGSIEIQQNRQKRTKGATCDCCLKTDDTAKGTQWHSVCLGWRVAVALATNQFHRCLNVQDVVICHKCYQLTSGVLREACAGILIAHPEINGLQNFAVPHLPEALKVLQVCFNSRGAIGCYNAIHTSLRPSIGWSVLPAPVGSQVYLIPGEGDSWAGAVLLVSADGGMITVADSLAVDSQIIVNHFDADSDTAVSDIT